MTAERKVWEGRPRQAFWLAALLVVVGVLAWSGLACGDGSDQNDIGETDRDLEIPVNDAGAAVGNAWVTVRAIESAFQPVSPPQKLSDETLAAPAAGESFYQGYVRVENKGSVPLRVDPEDFVCRIGNAVTTLEPTRSGPKARSIISGSSLDLVVTFRGKAGMEPILIYDPPWYGGLIYFSTTFKADSFTTTTQGADAQSTTTTSASGL